MPRLKVIDTPRVSKQDDVHSVYL